MKMGERPDEVDRRAGRAVSGGAWRAPDAGAVLLNVLPQPLSREREGESVCGSVCVRERERGGGGGSLGFGAWGLGFEVWGLVVGALDLGCKAEGWG